MRARPPATEAWVARDVGRAERLLRLEHRAEQPVGARQRAHRSTSSSVIPAVMNCANPPSTVGDPERRVAGARQLARDLDDAPQHPLDRALGRDCQHGLVHGLERADLSVIADDDRGRPSGDRGRLRQALERGLHVGLRELGILELPRQVGVVGGHVEVAVARRG